MTNNTETAMIEDGAICKLVVRNTTGATSDWDNEPIWYVNYTIFHGHEGAIEIQQVVILQQQSCKNELVDFQRVLYQRRVMLFY